MATELEWTPIVDLDPRPIRASVTASYPSVSSVTVTGWPNAMAGTPDEVIGKQIKVEEGNLQGIFIVESVEGNKLNLRYDRRGRS